MGRESWSKPFQFLGTLAIATFGFLLIGIAGIIVPPLLSWQTADGMTRAKPGSCGSLRKTSSNPLANATAAWASRELRETMAARTYAIDYYGGSRRDRQRSPFPVTALPFIVDTSAACPFDLDMCLLGPNGSISFDTGLLDSHHHLGINAPKSERIQYRRKTTCTPLLLDSSQYRIVTDGERDGYPVSKNAPLVEFDLGSAENTNYTFSWQAPSPANRVGYFVQTKSAVRGFSSNMSWIPVSRINRTDADITLVLIARALIAYSATVNDAVFQANGTKKNPVRQGSQLLYLPDHDARIIACADQHQICDPVSVTCSKLDGVLGSTSQVLDKMSNDRQMATAIRIKRDSASYNTEPSIQQMGETALIASTVVGKTMLVSPGLPENQWHLETKLWFETALARLQAHTTDFVDLSVTEQDVVAFEYVPARGMTGTPKLDEALDAMCSEQRIRSQSSVQNFNIFTLCFITVGSVVCAVFFHFVFPRVVRRVAGDGYAEWEKDGLLELWKCAKFYDDALGRDDSTSGHRGVVAVTAKHTR